MTYHRATVVLLAVLAGGLWAEQGSADTPFLVRVGEVLEFSLDGELWTYAGYAERDGERVDVRLEREVGTTATVFRGKFVEAGTYEFEFFRQDARSGELIKRRLAVEVSEAEGSETQTEAEPSPSESDVDEVQQVTSDADAVGENAEEGTEMSPPDGAPKPVEDFLVELLRLAAENGNVTSRIRATWPDAEHVELVEQALRRLSATEMAAPPALYRSFPELMYRLAWMLERAPADRDLRLAHHLYHRLTQDYPANPLAADAARRDRELERDFIWVY